MMRIWSIITENFNHSTLYNKFEEVWILLSDENNFIEQAGLLEKNMNFEYSSIPVEIISSITIFWKNVIKH